MDRQKCYCQQCQKARSRIEQFRNCLSNFDRLEGWRNKHSSFKGYCLDQWGYCPLDVDVETLLISSRKKTAVQWDEEDNDKDF